MRKVALVLWRIWFYVLAATPVVLLFFPLALMLLLPNGYRYVFWVARNIWAPFVLLGMGFWVKKMDTFPPEGKSFMLVANHTSYIDIMVMLRMRKTPFVFVGKKELSKIPLFGFIYKRTCILVDRNDSKSRRNVYKSAQQKINQGYSICIFPEGGVPFDESIVLDTFKDGAFRLAIEHHLPIVPMTFHDNKKRFSYTFFSGGPGKIRALIHAPLLATNYSLEMKKELKAKTRAIILNELENPSL